MKSIIDRINANTFLTDGGLETDMIFTKNIDLPHFAAFPMLDNPKHIHVLQNYYREYLDIAKNNGTGYILESPTWTGDINWVITNKIFSELTKRLYNALRNLKKPIKMISVIFL